MIAWTGCPRAQSLDQREAALDGPGDGAGKQLGIARQQGAVRGIVQFRRKRGEGRSGVAAQVPACEVDARQESIGPVAPAEFGRESGHRVEVDQHLADIENDRGDHRRRAVQPACTLGASSAPKP
ncbi:hypothetical protein [Pararhodobacter marinus]|uniref:hypothetical protein n=1 Tax=Pararhodobacter marinus TaxID=2184063 RepID=UPI00351148F7